MKERLMRRAAVIGLLLATISAGVPASADPPTDAGIAGENAAATGPTLGSLNPTTIRPGKSGKYPLYYEQPGIPKSKLMGRLAGRDVIEYDTPAKISGMGKYMAEDTKGNIWYVETREDKVIRIDPRTTEMTQYLLPRGAAPYSIAIDSNDALWITAHGIEMLLEVHPARGEVIAHQPPSHGFLIHVNIDRRTNTVWFSQPGNNQIVSYRSDKGFQEYPCPTKQAGPGRMDFDSKGNVWYPELYTDKLAMLDVKTGATTEYPLPAQGGLPAGVRIDRATDTIWVNQPMLDRLLAFRDGKFTEYAIPTAGSVVSTNVSDEDGYVWFTEGGWRGSAGGNKIGRLDPRTKKVEEMDIPYGNAQPLGMVRGQDGSIWFSLVTGAKVCRIAPRATRGKGE